MNNKISAFVVLVMGINAGMQIVSNIWNPSAEKIPLTILFISVAVMYITKIKDPIEQQEKDKISEDLKIDE